MYSNNGQEGAGPLARLISAHRLVVDKALGLRSGILTYINKLKGYLRKQGNCRIAYMKLVDTDFKVFNVSQLLLNSALHSDT